MPVSDLKDWLSVDDVRLAFSASDEDVQHLVEQGLLVPYHAPLFVLVVEEGALEIGADESPLWVGGSSAALHIEHVEIPSGLAVHLLRVGETPARYQALQTGNDGMSRVRFANGAPRQLSIDHVRFSAADVEQLGRRRGGVEPSTRRLRALEKAIGVLTAYIASISPEDGVLKKQQPGERISARGVAAMIERASADETGRFSRLLGRGVEKPVSASTLAKKLSTGLKALAED